MAIPFLENLKWLYALTVDHCKLATALTALAALPLGESAINPPEAAAYATKRLEAIDALSLRNLQDRRSEILSQLNQLASFNLRVGIGTICYRSMPSDDADATQWIQINFDREYPFDQIALIPAIWRDNENGYRDDGFPIEFSILAGSASDPKGKLIAEVAADSTILPRIAPLLINCPDHAASWIRIEGHKLSKRFHDGSYIMQFAEIMVFDGAENIALNQEVVASSEQRAGVGGAYKLSNSVDGFLPYLMDASQGQKSNPYLSGFDVGKNATFTNDLGTAFPISKIRIHTIEQGDTIPHALQPNFAVPSHLVFEGANQPDFSDAIVLWDYEHKDLFEISPIVTKRLAEPQHVRYLRLRTIKEFIYEGYSNTGIPLAGSRIGFAEIEYFAEGRNVVRGKTPTPNYDTTFHDPNRPISSLTDGHNIFGEILPFRTWMAQLAQRHELENELPFVNLAIEDRVEKQKTMLQIWIWSATAFAALAVFIFLIDRILRQRAIFRTRERIAADLHDELGANLHAIGLLGELALASNNSPEKSANHIERIRALAGRTSKAVKYCTNMLDTPGLYQDLPLELNQIARRLMPDLDHDLKIIGERFLDRIRPRKRIDLFLFYKECLINILRHSNASKASSIFELTEDRLKLTVSDNGTGIKDSDEPKSLRRRARLVGAKLQVSPIATGGTQVNLEMKI